MPFTINFNNCLGAVRNTGTPQCYLDPNFITGAIIAPRGTILDGTTQSLSTALTALLYNASKTSRGYPVYDLEKMTPSSDKLQKQSMPTGAEHPVREGYEKHEFQFFDGGLSKLQALRTFNGSNWDGPTVNKIQAFPCNPGGFIWAPPQTPNTGTERTGYLWMTQFKQTYWTDQIANVGASFVFENTFPGLNDVNVLASATVNATTKQFNVCLVSPLGTDIGALYSAALSGSGGPAMWTGSVVAGGASLTISTVVWVPSTVAGVPGYFTITVGATGYPTPPAPIFLNLANASTLQAAGVPYESTGALSIASV
jgi:hypothetical protein